MNNIFNFLHSITRYRKFKQFLWKFKEIQHTIPLQRLLQSLQIFVGLSTGPGLQNWPNPIIYRFQIRRVGRPFRRCDEIGKIGLTQLLPRFRSVCWSGILFKCPLLSAEVATGPRNHHGVQDVTAVNVLVNLYTLIDENQTGRTGGVNSGSTHHGLWILVVFGDSIRTGSLGAQAHVVIVGLFDYE